MSYKTTITAEEVVRTINPVAKIYGGKGSFVAPDGYEFTSEFRFPVRGEVILGASGGDYVATAQSDISYSERLILRKIPKEKNYKFTYIGTRPPKVGEYYIPPNSAPKIFRYAYVDFSQSEITYKCYAFTEEEA